MAATIQVEVRLFAQLRESFGVSDVTVQLRKPADLAALLAALDLHFAHLAPSVREQLFATNTRIAINQQLVEDDAALTDGDEIAFLPPVTGG